MSTQLKLITISTSFITWFILNRIYLYKITRLLKGVITDHSLSFTLAYILIGIPSFLILLMIHKPEDLMKSNGLSSGFFKALVPATIITVPMFIGYGTVFNLSDTITLKKIVVGCLCAGFFEELYFRGLLFGQLYRYTKAGFIPSALPGAIIFGLIHIYQGNSPASAAGVFAVTAIGALYFSWLYAEWKYNLWIVIWIHILMNFSWMLFSSGSNALGGLYSNIFRVASIITAIVLTLIYRKREGIKREILFRHLWIKK